MNYISTNKKNIVLMVIAALAMAMLSGCFMRKPDTQKMLVKYMQNRYPDEEFTIAWTDWISYDDEQYITTVYFNNGVFTDGEICAVIAYESGRWIYRDNFILLRNKGAIESDLNKLAQDYFGLCKVYVNYVTRYISDEITPDTGPDYIYQNCDAEIVIYLPPDDKDRNGYKEATKAFYDRLTDDGRERFFGTVWMVKSQDAYDSIQAIFDSLETIKYEDITNKVGSFGTPVYYPKN